MNALRTTCRVLAVAMILHSLPQAEGQSGSPPATSFPEMRKLELDAQEFQERLNQSQGHSISGRADVKLVPPATSLDGRKLDNSPRPLRSPLVQYPDFMLNHGPVAGTVDVELTVGSDASVGAPRILSCSHSAFVPPVVAALNKTPFAPGTIGGVAVASRAHWRVNFDVTGGRWDDRIGSAFAKFPRKPPPDAPSEFQYDRPPRVLELREAVYPFDLLLRGVEGAAEVSFVVGRDGLVQTATISQSTHPEFGAALRAAIESWRFAPASRSGRPTLALLSWNQKFSPFEQSPVANLGNKRVLALLRAPKHKLPGLADLDRHPRPLYQAPPVYPPSLRVQRVPGAAEIQFIIDRDGKARLPRIVSATHPEFGWAAATAVQQWVFERPLSAGQPIDVLVTIPIEFEPPQRIK